MSRVTIRRDGRRISAAEGQSVAAALWAHGDRALSRSLKFHRPRGYLCGTGRCNQCMMRVDGVPNVKTCMVPVRDGMVVTGQNAWPSVRHDMFRGADVVFRHGFDHHRAFLRPRFLYPLFSKVIRAFAGWGKLPDDPAAAPQVETARPDVVVVGGGPAGLAAAVAAARAGASTMVFDDRRAAGGAAGLLTPDVDDPDTPGARVAAATLVARWSEEAARTPGLVLHERTAVAAAYREGLVLAQGPGRAYALAPRALVVATGAHEAQATFMNNDLPGVMTATGCLTLLADGVLPGKRAVVYGGGPHGRRVTAALTAADIPVVAVVEPRADASSPSTADPRSVPAYAGATVTAALGRGRVRRVRVQQGARVHTLEADLLVVALGSKTAPELFQALGAQLMHDPWQGGAVPVLDDRLMTTVPGLFAAGDCAGVGTLAAARASGRLAGLAAAAHAGHTVTGLDETLERERSRLRDDPLRRGGPRVAQTVEALA